ncbi:MAG: hypothetical protein WBB34_14055 [Xanthobacteraceae bacterium]
MEKQKFVVQFDNGTERRSTVTAQPDAVFAMMFGQRHAWDAFNLRWNCVMDQRKWTIVVIAENGERHEEPFVVTLPFAAANNR